MKNNTLKDYYLSKEIVELGKFHSANISMAIKPLEEGEDYIKISNLIFLNKRANVTNNIKKIFSKTTPLNDLIPEVYIKKELGINLSKFKDNYDIITISGINFYKFKNKLKEVFSKNTYVLNDIEVNEATQQDYIDGYLKITNKKYLVWY